MQPYSDQLRFTYAGHEHERELLDRISTEFYEMPGLKLTVRQACRLFSLEPTLCERVLGDLVDGGVLATDGRAFARADVNR
jgi:hypothetical protein